MKAVITVVGKDTVGILAKVSAVCADYEANVIEVTQSVLQDLFAMIMLVELGKKNFKELSEQLNKLGEENNLKIHSMHEDIFNSMHKI
ncbi:MAG: ACT domain-containing protein [Ruminococcus sp.]|nr:ACT domain-containing protein [Ruminococcus sp.]